MSSYSEDSMERNWVDDFVDEYYIRADTESEVTLPPRTYVESLLLGIWFWKLVAIVVVVKVVWWVGEMLVSAGADC